MIRPLRRLHRQAFVGAAIVGSVLMVTALAKRAPQPGASALPGDVATGGRRCVVLESDELWRSVAIATRVLMSKDGSYDVELSSAETNNQPDLLLYWTAGASAGRLPESSRLLGPYSGGTQRFVIPADIELSSGSLILYSLAHQTVFATAEVPSHGS